MPSFARGFFWCLTVLACGLFVGCSDSVDPNTKSETKGKSSEEGTSKDGATSTNDSKKSPSDSHESSTDPDEPFVAPTLDTINATANWFDQPVVNLLERRRQQEADTKAPISADEALKVRNTGAKENSTIIQTLGRVSQKPEEIDFEATLNRHIKADARSTNPLFASSVYETDVNGLLSPLPLTFDHQFERVGDAELIVSWQTSSDRMMDKLVIRDDLTWSDGTPVTAHDLEFSFNTIMDKRIEIPAIRTSISRLKGVKAYDDRTVVYFHKEALASHIWTISVPFLPRHIYEKTLAEDPTMQQSDAHVALEMNPVVCGPYKLVQRERGSLFVFERREEWFMHQGKQVREKPAFKEIRFRVIGELNTALLAMKKGEIDEMELSAEQWSSQTIDDDFYNMNTKASGVEWTTYLFTWNLGTPYFSDIRVRKAMSLAFNYKELHEKLNFGLFEPSNGPFHHTGWMAPHPGPKPYEQNLDEAENLLDEAGWVDSDGDGIRDKVVNGKRVNFEFSIICTPVQERIRLCTLLKECLGQIGVTCNVSPLEFSVLQERTVDHNFQAAFGGWGSGADPDLSHNIYGSGQGRNYGYYTNPEVDKLYAEARKEFDKNKRAKLYGRIHELIYADQPMTYLFTKNSFYGFSNKLRGYQFSPRGPYHYSPGWASLYKVKN